MTDWATTDLIEIARADVVEKARNLYQVWRSLQDGEKTTSSYDAVCEVLAAVTLLTERERMVGEMRDR